MGGKLLWMEGNGERGDEDQADAMCSGNIEGFFGMLGGRENRRLVGEVHAGCAATHS